MYMASYVDPMIGHFTVCMSENVQMPRPFHGIYTKLAKVVLKIYTAETLLTIRTYIPLCPNKFSMQHLTYLVMIFRHRNWIYCNIALVN